MNALPRYYIQEHDGGWYLAGGPTYTPRRPYTTAREANHNLGELNAIVTLLESRLQAMLRESGETGA